MVVFLEWKKKMKATGSKLIKVAKIQNLDVYQDTDTKKIYVEILGTLEEIPSIAEAIKYTNPN